MATTSRPHSDGDPQPIHNSRGASILGPRTLRREREIPIYWPRLTPTPARSQISNSRSPPRAIGF